MTESYCENIFGEISQKNVVFCIETSGNMLSILPVVKKHLQFTLEKMAANERKIYFNIIEFNSRVLAWADKLICSTHETVAMAIDWLNELSARTGCNTLDALRSAFRQECVDAVYFVTCSQPEQHPDAILDEIIPLSKGCPIHCIYFTGDVPDDIVENLLEDLSLETRGTFYIFQSSNEKYSFSDPKMLYSSNNKRQSVIRSTSGDRYSPEKTCSVTSTLQFDPGLVRNSYPVMYPFGIGMTPITKPIYYPTREVFPYYLSKACLRNKQFEVSPYLSPGAGAILIGKKVLAQNYDDGYFYMGEVHSQIRPSDFLVAFGPCHHRKYSDTIYQETNICDIIDNTESLRHSIEVGDCVLAPGQPPQGTDRFSCGRVLEGREARQSELKYHDVELVVSFENGITSKIPRDVAIWIPKNIYDQIKLKVHQPRSLKQEPYYRSHVEMPETFSLEPSIWTPSLKLGSYHPMTSPPYVPVVPMIYNVAEAPLHSVPYLSQPTWYPRYRVAAPKYSVSTEDVLPVSKLSIKELDDKVSSLKHEHKEIAKKEKEQPNVSSGQEKEVLADVYQPIPCETDKATYDTTKNLKDTTTYLPRNPENLPDLGFYDDNGLEESYQKYANDVGVNTEPLKLLAKSTVPDKPLWKYWAKSPTRNLGVSKRNLGSFQETTVEVPFELRDRNRSLYQDYASNSAFHYVDRFSKHTHNDSVAALLKTPKPPSTPPPTRQEQNPTQPPNNCKEYRENSGQKECFSVKPCKTFGARRPETTEEQQKKKKKYQGQRKDHLERILQNIISETNDKLNRQEQIDMTHAAKRVLNAEISLAAAKYKHDHHHQLQQQQQQRTLLQNKCNVQVKPATILQNKNIQQQVKGAECLHNRGQQHDETIVIPFDKDQKKQQRRYQKSQRHWANVHRNLVQKEFMEDQKDKESQKTRLRQIEHFKKLEEANQKKKLNNHMHREQQLALYRSKILL